MPDKRNLSRGGFTVPHMLRVQSIMVGGAWWQEDEAAGYIA